MSTIQLNTRSDSRGGDVFWTDDTLTCQVMKHTASEVPVTGIRHSADRLFETGCLPAPSSIECLRDRLMFRWSSVGKLTYSWEWPVEGWRAAALTVLRSMRVLHECGLSLSKLRPFDVFMAGTRPLITNLHSLTRWSPDDEANIIESVERHFVRPLKCAMNGQGEIVRRVLKGGPQGLGPEDAVLLLGGGNGARTSVPQLIEWLEGLTVQGANGQGHFGTYEAQIRDNVPEELAAKTAIVENVFDRLKPASVLDLACNSGKYAMMASAMGATVTGVDVNEWCMNTFFVRSAAAGGRASGVVMDLRDPPPTRGWGMGWSRPVDERLSSECLVALAFLHHVVRDQWTTAAELGYLLDKLASKWLLLEIVPPRTQGPYVLESRFFGVEWLLAVLGGRFVKREAWHYGRRGRHIVLLERVSRS